MIKPYIAFVSLLVCSLTACSSFNLSPQCEETFDGLRRNLAVRDAQEVPDFPRLRALIEVADPKELSADYNRRTCSAIVSSGGSRANVTYVVSQAEGVKNWYEIDILNRNDPELLATVGVIQRSYNAD